MSKIAKSYVRKIKLTFDYDEVKEGVKQTNNQLKMLNAEYKAIKAESRSVADTTQKLAQRKDFLNEKLKIINGSLEEYKKRLESAKEKENAKAVEKYTVEIQKAEQELRIIQSDIKDVNKKLDEQKKFLGKTAEDWDKIGKKVGPIGKTLTKKVTAPILAASAAAFKLGGDYEQALGKMQVVFGENSAEIEKWAQGALKNFGLSRLSAVDMVADFGAMFDNFGFKMQENMDMSKALAERVRDLGAFYNTTAQETTEALNAIFTGQVQPLRKFGVVITQAALQEYAHAEGINKKISEMTEAEKVQLRYNYVMEKTSIAVGQYQREYDDASTKLDTFKETLKELGVTFGEVVIPAVVPFLTALTNGLNYIASLDEGTKNFIVRLALFAAAIGPVLVGLSTVIKATRVVREVTSGAAKAIGSVTKANNLFNSVLENQTFLKLAKWAALVIAVAVAIWALVEAINALRGRKSTVSDTIKEVNQLSKNVKGGKMRGYAVGSKYIEQDQVAMIHKGEAVLPAKNNPWNPNASDPFGGKAGGDIILNVSLDEVGEVYKLMETVKKARQMKRAGVVNA